MAVPRPRATAPGGPLQTTDDRITDADHVAEGRSAARLAGSVPGHIPGDAVAPQPLPRGYVHPW
jgi:hypothetical protein